MASRFGSALILIGLIGLVVFILSYQVQLADYDLLLFSLGFSVAGLIFRRRAARKRQSDAGRFRLLRRLRGTEEDLDEKS